MSEQLYRRVQHGKTWRYEPIGIPEGKQAHVRLSESLARMWGAIERAIREEARHKWTPASMTKAVIQAVAREERR